jgi:hypothetical protein
MHAKTLVIAVLLAGCSQAPQPRSSKPEIVAAGKDRSPTKIICDRAHTTFDAAGNTYCQEIPTNGIRVEPLRNIPSATAVPAAPR